VDLGGRSAGIDVSLHLVDLLSTKEVSDKVIKEMEAGS
jgi:hypothetical protein